MATILGTQGGQTSNSGAPKPTVLGTPPPAAASRPTVLFTPPPAPPQAAPARPTMLSMPPPAVPQAPAAAPAAPPPKAVVLGKAPLRVPVTDESVRAANTATLDQEVIGRAVAIVRAVEPERLCGQEALLWGQATQERHGQLVDESLKLAQSSELENARRRVTRIVEILGSLHLEKIFTAGKTGIGAFIGGLTGKATASVDTPAELEAALAELNQLTGLLRQSTTALVALREQIEENARQIVENGKEVEASLCAAVFLAAHVRAHPGDFRPDTANHLDARAQNLFGTVAGIKGNGAVRKVQADNPVSFIQLIQNVALVTLPNWLQTLTALKVASATRKVNPTEIGEANVGLQQVTAALRQ